MLEEIPGTNEQQMAAAAAERAALTHAQPHDSTLTAGPFATGAGRATAGPQWSRVGSLVD